MYDTDKYYVIAKDLIKTTDFQKTLETWEQLSKVHTGKKVFVLEEGSHQYSILEAEGYGVEEICLNSIDNHFKIKFQAYTKNAMNLIIGDGERQYNRYISLDDFIHLVEIENRTILSIPTLQFKAEKFRDRYMLLQIKDREVILDMGNKDVFLSNLKGLKNYA